MITLYPIVLIILLVLIIAIIVLSSVIMKIVFEKRIKTLECEIENLSDKFDNLDRYVTWKTKSIGIPWSKKIYDFLVSVEDQIIYKIKTYLEK